MAEGARAGGGEAVVRGELVDRTGRGPTLVAIRRLRWGTQVLSERPVMLVEADPDAYLRAGDADPRLAELAEAMGDPYRLAAYVAFKQLHERKQRELLSFWREGIEESDPVARAVYEANRAGVDEFVKDRPEFSKLVFWNHFVLVASIFGRFGLVNPDGTRGVYAFCSHIRHSCRPNAAWFTNRHGFPRGKKVLHVVGADGIPRGEEVTVSHADEAVLMLPRAQRAARVRRSVGLECDCRRCGEEAAGQAEQADGRISEAFARLQALLAVRPPTDDSAQEAQQCLRELDRLLPFSMQLKAKAKVLLAALLSELSQRAAWQEESRGANIVRWTGLDAERQEQRLRDTKRLYETAAKDFEYLLGQDALAILKRLEAGYGPVHDQHKMLAKYSRERAPGGGGGEAEGGGEASRAPGPAAGGAAPGGGEGLPPSWDELFRGRAPA
mmetsp:Transcript_65618/g.203135  ORF Transcript_65618/g.203135 Transcript_65618/m.203135 type:complete len:441 (+) Transcript_65618:88-1410(+)